MDGHRANRTSPIGAALSGAAGSGALAAAQALVSTLRDRAASAGDRRGSDGAGDDAGALRAHRWLPAGGHSAQPGPRRGRGDGVDAGGNRGADRALSFGRACTLDAGGGVAARALGQGRGTVAGGAGPATVPHQELGIAPTGFAQSALARSSGQGRVGKNSAPSGDEVSVAVGPGQRRARAQAGCGTGRAPAFGSPGGTAVCRVPSCRYSRARSDLRFATAVSTNGRAERARGCGAVHRRGSFGFRSRRYCRTVRTRPWSGMRRDLRRGNGCGARPNCGRAGGGTRVVCDALAGARAETRP